MIQAVIFDYDGVIVDSTDFHKGAYQQIFSDLFLEFNDSIFNEFFLGKTLALGLNDYLTKIDKQELFRNIITQKKNRADQYLESVTIYPDAQELIKRLTTRYQLALCTGSEAVFVQQTLKKYRLDTYFKCLVTVESYQNGKPNPEPYLKVLDSLKIDCESAVAIEDSPAGVTAAQKAGLYCIAVNRDHNKAALNQANLIVNNLYEIDLNSLDLA